jgi:hypothetical protein
LKHSVEQFPVHGYFDPMQSRTALHLVSSDVLLSLQSLQAEAVPHAYPLLMILLTQFPPPSMDGRPASVDVVPPAPDTPPLDTVPPPEPLTPPVDLLPPAEVTPPAPVLPPEPMVVVPPVGEAVVPPVDTTPPVSGVPPAFVPQQKGGFEPPLLLT